MERYIDPPAPACALEAERITWHLEKHLGDDRKYRRDRFRMVQPETALELAEIYLETHSKKDYKAANLQLYYATESAKELLIPHGTSNEQLRRFAALSADRYRRELFDSTDRLVKDVKPIVSRLKSGRFQLGFPPGASDLAIARRLADKAWWLRALRKVHRKQAECWAIDQGMVHKDRSIYVSKRNLTNRRAQKSKTLDFLAELVAVNEEGDELRLSDLNEHSIANPSVRRSELMARIRGTENFAIENDYVGLFVTLTCPSRMHAYRIRPNRTQLDDRSRPNSVPNRTEAMTEPNRNIDRTGSNSGANWTENSTELDRNIDRNRSNPGPNRSESLTEPDRSKPVTQPIRTGPQTGLNRSPNRSEPIPQPVQTDSSTDPNRSPNRSKPVGEPDQTGLNPVFRNVERNPAYDGTKPDQAQDYLCAVWARIRAKWKRDGLEVFGLRVTEPNHDGTPHWHLILFCKRNKKASVVRTLRHHALQDSPNEPGAQKYRLKVVNMDPSKGSATGYIAKYISKNLDGHKLNEDLFGTEMKETCDRVDAWRATWNIRGFQFIGTKIIGVWRELRRLRQAIPGPVEAFRKCADEGDFKSFIGLIGGPCVLDAGRAIRLAKAWLDKPGKYGDPIGYRVIGVTAENVTVLTRLHQWTIERRSRKLAPLEFCQ